MPRQASTPPCSIGLSTTAATLTATVESLHIIAAQKLMELLQTEKDPNLLARLIATAFRFKLSRLPRPAGDTPPPPARNNARPKSNGEKDADTHAAPPQPYTEEEFGTLCLKYGEDKAAKMNNRREALIAEFTHARRNTANAG